MERLREEIKKGKSNFEELVKKEALLLDIAKWWYLIRLGELGVYEHIRITLIPGVYEYETLILSTSNSYPQSLR